MQKNQFLFILSLIFAVIVCLFALTNGDKVVINLFFYKLEGSLALVIFLSAMLGAIVLGLLGIGRFLRFRFEIKRLKKENEILVAKIEELKNPPKEADSIS